MPEDWRDQLIARYPDLFRRTVRGQEITTGYPRVDDGWREIVEKALERMAAAVQGQPRGSLQVVQIKEKLGGLRLYYNAGRLDPAAVAKVEEAVDLAEARADCTCEVCGRAGRLFNNDGSLATRCEMHGRGKPVPLSDDANTFVKYEVDGTGRRRIISRRRYDRAGDRFIDIPEEP